MAHAHSLTTQHSLTEKQAEVVRRVVAGEKWSDAVKHSGYAFSPKDVWQLSNSRTVLAAVAEGMRRQLIGKLAPIALNVLDACLSDENPKIRIEAAKTVMDRAGFIAPKAVENKEIFTKSLAEMTRAELADAAARAAYALDAIRAESAAKAKPVLEHDAQPIDILE